MCIFFYLKSIDNAQQNNGNVMHDFKKMSNGNGNFSK